MENIKTYFEIEAGAVITRLEGDELKFLAIHRVKMNDFTLPKGHLEDGESLEEAAVREVLEETGHTVALSGLIDSFEYKVKEFHKNQEAFIIRRVYFFAGTVDGAVVAANNPDFKEGKIVPSWLSYEDALAKFTYDTDKDLIKKVYFQNKSCNAEYVESICAELAYAISDNPVVSKNLLKFGVTGSVNDQEFSIGWSDLDFMLILKTDPYGNIERSVLSELRKISAKIFEKHPHIEISCLTHTYDDFQKYVAFEYLNHYKFTRFIIENDSVDFVAYIEKLIANRNISLTVKQRYAVYHLRHFRFNLLRKVVATRDDKKALKLIIDKLIEVMILFMTYHEKSIKGKMARLEEIKELDIPSSIKSIFADALEKRKNWQNLQVHNSEVDEWLKNFEEVVTFILKDNLFDVPEEFINSN